MQHDERALRDLVDWQIAEGTNGLLKQGATLCTEAADVITVLRPILGQRLDDAFDLVGLAAAGLGRDADAGDGIEGEKDPGIVRSSRVGEAVEEPIARFQQGFAPPADR